MCFRLYISPFPFARALRDSNLPQKRGRFYAQRAMDKVPADIAGDRASLTNEGGHAHRVTGQVGLPNGPAVTDEQKGQPTREQRGSEGPIEACDG